MCENDKSNMYIFRLILAPMMTQTQTSQATRNECVTYAKRMRQLFLAFQQQQQ